MSEYEGKQEYVRTIKLPGIEVIENKYPDKEYTAKIEYPEFSTLCPKTGLPDYATIEIVYNPNEFLAELKSLKLYFVAFRDKGFFHEHFTNRIFDDFIEAVKPVWAKIEVRVNPRGGITTTIRREYPTDKER
jgi:7-cyano-7-deazaguanine reductase